MVRMTSSAASPCSASRNRILPRPTPCSPEQVPSIASARSTRRSVSRSAAASSSDDSGFTGMTRWKLPSPTCPISGPSRREVGEIGLGLADAVGQPGDRDARVGRPAPRSRAQRQRGMVGVVARLPQLRALFRRVGPREIVAAVSVDDGARPRRLLGDVRGAQPVKLEEEHRRHRIAQSRVTVDGIHLHLVEELDARDRNPELDDRDDGL